MTTWVQPILDYLSQNPATAWAIIFLVSMGEALFVVGLVVPSTAVLVGAGTLVGLGKLQFWPVFLMTILGAIAGDAIGVNADNQFLATIPGKTQQPQVPRVQDIEIARDKNRTI